MYQNIIKVHKMDKKVSHGSLADQCSKIKELLNINCYISANLLV